MGVPKLFAHLRVRYPSIVSRRRPDKVSSLFDDANATMHPCAAIVYGYDPRYTPKQRKEIEDRFRRPGGAERFEEEFFQLVVDTLYEHVRVTKPEDFYFIAVDGVAPRPKINQQRMRRYKGAKDRAALKKTPIFDPNCLTPGTPVMVRFQTFLENWVTSMYNKGLLPRKTIISGHLTPGEGEHKIMDQIRGGAVRDDLFDNPMVIYSPDADLIMLASALPAENIFIMREVFDPNSHDVTDRKTYQYLDIKAYKEEVTKEFGSEMAVYDLMIMLFYSGNDFLPHLPSLNNLPATLPTMLDVYKELRKTWSEDQGLYTRIEGLECIDWDNMREFLTAMKEIEPQLLMDLAQLKVDYPSKHFVDSFRMVTKKGKTEPQIDFDKYRQSWYANALGPRGDESVIATCLAVNPKADIFSMTGLDSEMDQEEKEDYSRYQIEQMAIDYFRGMEWVFSYYVNGRNFVLRNFSYEYSYAPMLWDLQQVSQGVNQPNKGGFILDGFNRELKYSMGKVKNEDEEDYTLNPVHQLVAVIPPRSIGVLPPGLELVYKKESPLFDTFPADFIYELDDQPDDKHGVVLMPPAETERIVTVLDEVNLMPAWIRLYGPKPEFVLEVEPGIREYKQNLKSHGPRDAKRIERGEPIRTERGRGRGRGNGDRGRGGGQDRTERDDRRWDEGNDRNDRRARNEPQERNGDAGRNDTPRGGGRGRGGRGRGDTRREDRPREERPRGGGGRGGHGRGNNHPPLAGAWADRGALI